MQDPTELGRLLSDLIADLQDLSVLWQLGVLAVCVGLGWLAGRYARSRRLAPPSGRLDQTARITVGSFNRIVSPLVALALVLLGRWSLRHYSSVHLLDLAVPLLFSFALVQIVVYLLRHAFAPSGMLRYWERTIAWGIWIGVALYITGWLADLRAVLDSLRFSIGKTQISMLAVLSGLLSVAVTVVLALWVGRIVEARLQGAQGLDASVRAVLSKLTRTVLVILAVLIALPLVGIDLTVLSVFGGALGVGIGFGLQKIAANYISGFIILLDRSISPGDLITIDNKYGSVSRLTSRYIVVRGLDGTEAIIPNETVVSSTVVNHSYSDKVARIDLPIQVGYRTDLDLALRLLQQTAEGNPRVLASPSPTAFLKDFGDSGVNLELYVWIDDPESGRANLKSDLYLAIWKAFQLHAIEIPYPQREVRIIAPAEPPAFRPLP